MGSDVSDKIRSNCNSLAGHYQKIKKLTAAECRDPWAYKSDMEWASHYFKQLFMNIRVGQAMISASEPKRKKETATAETAEDDDQA